MSYVRFLVARRALLLAYRWTIHLRTMSDGKPHPSARAKVLPYTFRILDGDNPWLAELSITSSRLALLGTVPGEFGTELSVWNWITGEMLLVC